MAEVFGFPITNGTAEALRVQSSRLCPFHNRVPSCTKSSATNPIGVCSVFHGQQVTITCPVRFRQDFIVLSDAAEFFFPSNSSWTSLYEVRLNDRHGKSAGNIDMVLVSYDDEGEIIDFGALEVQAVYT
nr:hypothetical protein [Chloroflexota bacterium]